MIAFLLLISSVDCPTTPGHPKATLIRVQEEGAQEFRGKEDCPHGFNLGLSEPSTKKICTYCIPEKCYSEASNPNGRSVCYQTR